MALAGAMRRYSAGGAFVPDSTAIYVYLGTFGLLLLAGLGLPIPEELPIIAAGATVGHASVEGPGPPPEVLTALSACPQCGFPGNLPWPLLVSDQLTAPRPSPLPSSLRWWIMLPVCILGAVTGDIFLYGVGRLGGEHLLRSRWMQRLLPPAKRQRTEENFQKYGSLVLVFARFLPTIRSPIFIMSGMMRVPLIRFILADGLAGIIGVSLLFTLAFWFGDQIRDFVQLAEGRIKSLIVLLLITAVVGYLIYHFLRHPVATGDPGEELPLVGGKVAARIEKPKSRSSPSASPPGAPDGDIAAPGTRLAEAGPSADGKKS